MATKIEALETKVLELGIEDRARLAEKLILSLDAPEEEENLRLWVAEAEQRLHQLRAGKPQRYLRAMCFAARGCAYMKRVTFHGCRRRTDRGGSLLQAERRAWGWHSCLILRMLSSRFRPTKAFPLVGTKCDTSCCGGSRSVICY